MKKQLIVCSFIIMIINKFIFCIEIPTQDINILRVGIVDMDKVLQEHPFVEKLQQEVSLMKQNKLTEIASIEKEVEELMKQKLNLVTEIEQIKFQIGQLKISTFSISELDRTTSSAVSVLTTTTTPPSDFLSIEQQNAKIEQLKTSIESKEKNLQQIEQTINLKKQQIKQKQEEINAEVEKIKQKTETELYTELYKIIRQIAQQEGINIVIDKSGILYGETQIDITDKVLKRIKK